MIGLKALRSRDLFEIYFISCFEDTVSLALNGRIVDKNLFSTLRFDKAVALLGRKPLDYARIRLLNDVVND